jgi:hypothetical protein
MMLVLRLLLVIVGQILSRAWGFEALVAWLMPSFAEECDGCPQCMKGTRASSDDQKKQKWTMSWRSESSEMTSP